MLQDDDISPIYEVPDCPSLDANNPIYSGLDLCLDGEDGRFEEDVKCPDNAYGVMLVPDGAVNAYNEKVAAFKVCAWCPAGEMQGALAVTVHVQPCAGALRSNACAPCAAMMILHAHLSPQSAPLPSALFVCRYRW